MTAEEKKSQQKGDKRLRIIEESMRMFAKQGIKAIKMDDIAARLGISKRTLYEQFANKEELLFHALSYYEERCKENVRGLIFDPRYNSIEKLLTLYRNMQASIEYVSPQFFEELEKYPIAKELHRESHQRGRRVLEVLLKRGVQEGFFRSDINYKAHLFLIVSLGSMLHERRQAQPAFPIKDLLLSLVLVQMRGISTPKGYAIIEKFTNDFKI